LSVLEIPFAQKVAVGQEGATWAERWTLQWTPEAEIAIVEAVLLGETIELATAVKFKQRPRYCNSSPMLRCHSPGLRMWNERSN